jgi:hypothetical protein
VAGSRKCGDEPSGSGAKELYSNKHVSKGHKNCLGNLKFPGVCNGKACT